MTTQTTHIEVINTEKIKPILFDKTEPLVCSDSDFKIGDRIVFFPYYENKKKGSFPYMIEITDIAKGKMNPSLPVFGIQNVDTIEFERITICHDNFSNFSEKEKKHLKSLFLYLDYYCNNPNHNPNDVLSIISNLLKVDELSPIDISWYFEHFNIIPKYFKLEV